MKKISKYFIFLSFLFWVKARESCLSQNLIPNPSFEYYTSCPTVGFYSVNQAFPWFNPTHNAPYYCNACSSNPQLSVPNNMGGFQYARTGNAYVMTTTFYGTPDGRTYVETPLLDTLRKGVKYCLEIFVSLSDNSEYTTNNLGVYFSKDSISDQTNWFYYLPYIPQIEHAMIITTDTANWVLISENYIASGGEKYLTIGNFRNDADTDTLRIGTSGMYAIYYIDDVSLYSCNTIDKTNSTLFIPNTFTPNGDGKNDVFKVVGENIKVFQGMIFNRWGELIYKWEDVNDFWDGRYKGLPVPNGIYVYKIEAQRADGTEYNKYGTVAVTR